MSGFSNSVIGGQSTLIRAAIKTPNYVPNTTGWSVNKDGTAEFNSLTARGTLNAATIIGALIENAAGTWQIDSSGNLFIFNTFGAVLFRVDTGRHALLFYADTGSAAQGALIASIAQANGSDSFGNAYQQGVQSYDSSNPNGHAGLFGVFLTVTNTAGGGFVLGPDSTYGAKLSTGAWFGGTLVRSDPNNINAVESWHELGAFSAGWSRGVNGYAKYSLLPDGQVGGSFNNIATNGTQVADGNAILTIANGLPPSYRPITAKRVPIYTDRIKTLGAAAFEAPALVFNTDGSVAILGIDSTATRIDGNFSFPISF